MQPASATNQLSGGLAETLEVAATNTGLWRARFLQNMDLNEYEFTMVKELLVKGHPRAEEKLAGGVKSIQLRINTEYDEPTKCFFIHRDGEDGGQQWHAPGVATSLVWRARTPAVELGSQ